MSNTDIRQSWEREDRNRIIVLAAEHDFGQRAGQQMRVGKGVGMGEN